MSVFSRNLIHFSLHRNLIHFYSSFTSLEAEEHQQRMKKLEELYDDHIEKIKRTIEKKIKQSQDLLNHHKENQKSLFNKNTENYTKTLALKAELEGKLDLWRKQVLSVQSLSIR